MSELTGKYRSDYLGPHGADVGQTEEERLTRKVAGVEAERDALAVALSQIVNRDVYSYLPRKEGVQVKISFDDLEAARNLTRGV